MKHVWMMVLLTISLATKVYAADVDGKQMIVPFDGVQEHCVQAGEVTFGPNGRWNSCHVTRGRWSSTIDLIDIYQAQYCLGKDESSCEQRALVLFANRAYTKDATILIQRIDPPDTIYDDPLVVIIGDDRLMSVSSRTTDSNKITNYYIWDAGHWMPLKLNTWQRDLSSKVPKGTSIRQAVAPSLESMSADVDLFKPSDADCCPTGGKAHVEFGFENENFVVKNVQKML